jgi:hypothetical protein
VNQASTTDFLPYQTSSLFLLVGRNPLPNYVTAKLLLRPDGILYLIHSEGKQGTGLIAQNLAACLTEYRPQLIAVNPQNTVALRDQVERYLDRTPPDAIGLNYTGGTKVMAVHAYQAVEEFCKRRGRQAIFSYLDADTLRLSIEPGLGHSGIRPKVMEAIALTFEDVFRLHGIGLGGELRTDPTLPGLAHALARMHGLPEGAETWRACHGVLASSNGRPWRDVKANLWDAGATPEVVDMLEQGLGLGDATPVKLSAVARQVDLDNKGRLLNWLHWEWLEDWSLACIKNLDYGTRARDLKGRKPGLFQLDVAVMRGYQLFAISCSVTRSRSVAKLKFLEVYTRALQIGGDEARAGLVVLVEDADGLEQEIASDWDAANRVRVFGREHLPELQEHFREWFEAV